MNKVEVFEKELGWIVDPKIRAFGEKLTECAPDYFFEVAASSTGKFHPSYALGAGGLVRHTKAAAHILHELLSLEMFNKYSQDTKDMMLVSIIAHDFFKHGLEATAGKYTVAEHPLVCADFIKGNAELCAMLEPEQVAFICGCISTHMGSFCTDYRTKKQILPKPTKGPQNMVHLADYLASRKYLIFDFGDEYYTPEPEPAEQTIDEELEALKASIVARCKEMIEAGVPQKNIYAIISDQNGGNRNPNSITTVEVGREVMGKLAAYCQE